MKHAVKLWICSIALGSALFGCAPATVPVSPAPVVMRLQPCAAPAVPTLPHLRDDMPLDAPAQVETLLTRDSRLRQYVQALRDTLACYDAQTTPREEKP